MKQKLLPICHRRIFLASTIKRLAVVIVLAYSSNSIYSQVKSDTTKTNAVNEFNLVKKKDGSNLIATTNGVRLFVIVRNGKVNSLTAIDGSGKDLPITLAAGAVECTACVKAKDSSMPICFEIPCKDLQKPLNTGGLQKIGSLGLPVQR